MKLLLGPCAALPCWRLKPESRTATAGAALPALGAPTEGRPVDRALAVQDQPAIGVGSVRAAGKTVQYFLRPLAAFGFRWTQLEHHAALAAVESIAGRAFGASVLRCSVQVARAVEDQIAIRQITLLSGGEAVQDGFRPRVALLARRRKLVQRATSAFDPQQHAVPGAAVSGCSIKVALAVDQQPSGGCVPVAVLCAFEGIEHGLGPRIALFRRWGELK